MHSTRWDFTFGSFLTHICSCVSSAYQVSCFQRVWESHISSLLNSFETRTAYRFGQASAWAWLLRTASGAFMLSAPFAGCWLWFLHWFSINSCLSDPHRILRRVCSIDSSRVSLLYSILYFALQCEEKNSVLILNGRKFPQNTRFTKTTALATKCGGR